MTCQRGSEANYEYEVGMERDMKLVLLNEEKILKKDERTNEDVKKQHGGHETSMIGKNFAADSHVDEDEFRT